MRSARDNALLKDDNGTVIGINLGADYCAEHEWGIEKLQTLFGIPNSGFGIERRKATETPGGGTLGRYVKLIDTNKHTVLVVSEDVNEHYFSLKHCYLDYRYKGEELLTAWDSKSFGISGVTKEDREAIRKIYWAIADKDIAIWTGGGGVFQNAGLVIAIASLVPADKKQMLYDADVDRDLLLKAAEKTGIAKKLEKAGKRYMALSPKWNTTIKNLSDSKYNVVFWLNPSDQQRNNYGYFTVENLEQWIEGEGPIPKKEV